jgi:two-component system sensor histidine kinase DesK
MGGMRVRAGRDAAAGELMLPRADPGAGVPVGGEEDEVRSGIGRGLAMTGMLVLFLAAPIAQLFQQRGGLLRPILLAGVLAVFLALFANLVMTRDRDLRGRPTPWWRLGALTVVGLVLPFVGDVTWLTVTGIIGATYAAYLPRVPAVLGVLAAGAFGGVFALVAGADDGTALVYTFEPLVIGGFAYASGRRVELIQQLRATRRELARTAVAEERLRISRDLHDLLGHSLSVIAVKAELARRMLPVDAARAEREIGEVEAAARRALHELGDAVTGYRAPSLAVELVSARRALTAAGIRCALDAPEEWDLPPEVDALLAWAAREGVTNVVRHSAAARCDLRLTIGTDTAALEVADDGRGPTEPEKGRAGGNGLPGLAERAAGLGGALSTDTADGFRLRVSVPVRPAG